MPKYLNRHGGVWVLTCNGKVYRISPGIVTLPDLIFHPGLELIDGEVVEPKTKSEEPQQLLTETPIVVKKKKKKRVQQIPTIDAFDTITIPPLKRVKKK